MGPRRLALQSYLNLILSVFAGRRIKITETFFYHVLQGLIDHTVFWIIIDRPEALFEIQPIVGLGNFIEWDCIITIVINKNIITTKKDSIRQCCVNIFPSNP